jgi:hypothetical protein
LEIRKSIDKRVASKFESPEPRKSNTGSPETKRTSGGKTLKLNSLETEQPRISLQPKILAPSKTINTSDQDHAFSQSYHPAVTTECLPSVIDRPASSPTRRDSPLRNDRINDDITDIDELFTKSVTKKAKKKLSVKTIKIKKDKEEMF